MWRRLRRNQRSPGRRRMRRRSGGTGVLAKALASCGHPMSNLLAWGGQNDTRWWTCLDCGSRWTRVKV
eukprot:8826039-Karenia_brevis.AAC.1